MAGTRWTQPDRRSPCCSSPRQAEFFGVNEKGHVLWTYVWTFWAQIEPCLNSSRSAEGYQSLSDAYDC
ncbi:unnamed protein product [Urochloa humidicola]